MLNKIIGAKLNSSIATNLFVAKSFKFFATKTFVAKGVVGHTISDKTNFVIECEK